MGRVGTGLLFGMCLLSAADPEPVQRLLQAPGGGAVPVRLVFKKGIEVQGAKLPRAMRGGSGAGWIAFEQLTPEGKRWVLKSLWPETQWKRGEIRHKVSYPEHESLWLLASLYCGRGQAYDLLQAANPGRPEKLEREDVWRIPLKFVSPDLGGEGLMPAPPQPEESLDDDARIAAYRRMLSYSKDGEGAYAAYRLRKGEALYSSVVMRYTDRVDPKDVHELAAEIAKRSGIRDVRSIPPGTEIRIPANQLAAPFQEEGAQALAEDREIREEVRRTTRPEAGPRLAGVTVVLDAGHGGVDPGARANGVWESDFVYDIAMRVRRQLLDETEAQVSSTLRYPDVGFRFRESIQAPSRKAQILTRPPFDNDGESPSAVSVHLRWVLANDILADHGRKGDPQKTLFLSFHADSLHPSAEGTMVYVPGAAGVPSSFSLSAARLPKVEEARRGARVAFSGRSRVQGEARSRLFSEKLLKHLRQASLPIHANRPIRNVIRRGRKAFVPAVIRYNAAAAKVLLEVANLQNPEDAARLEDPAFRARYAEAVVGAIKAYFAK